MGDTMEDFAPEYQLGNDVSALEEEGGDPDDGTDNGLPDSSAAGAAGTTDETHKPTTYRADD